MGWVLLQTMGSLLAVLALMVAVLFVLKKWVYSAQSGSQSSAAIDVLAHRTLQPKSSIYVVEVLGKILVVGVSEGGMQTLTEITSAAASPSPNLVEMEEYGPPHSSKKFVEYLKDNLGFVRPKNHRVSRSRNGGQQ